MSATRVLGKLLTLVRATDIPVCKMFRQKQTNPSRQKPFTHPDETPALDNKSPSPPDNKFFFVRSKVLKVPPLK